MSHTVRRTVPPSADALRAAAEPGRILVEGLSRDPNPLVQREIRKERVHKVRDANAELHGMGERLDHLPAFRRNDVSAQQLSGVRVRDEFDEPSGVPCRKGARQEKRRALPRSSASVPVTDIVWPPIRGKDAEKRCRKTRCRPSGSTQRRPKLDTDSDADLGCQTG